MPKRLTIFSFLLIFTLILLAAQIQKKVMPKRRKANCLYNYFSSCRFRKKIGGDYVNVEAIYPPGADSHTFEPSQNKQYKLQKPIYSFITVLN